MKKQSLNGIWEYRIGNGNWAQKNVPFSALCVGHSECKREFDLQEKSEVVLLKFDGITYNATVYVNGSCLGKMLPYCEYVYDITDIAREKGNTLFVEIEDINAAFGPSEGWENFGGIVRDVSIIYKNRAYIKDVFFTQELGNNYTDATYSVQVTSSIPLPYRVTLSYDGQVVDTYISDKAETRKISNVNLWSPDTPELYDLQVELLGNGQVADIYQEKVGFREFKCGKNHFILNGKDIFLKGVCRHEMYGESSGHTVSYEQIYKDMEMIKATGSNFVRLVHYPHNKATLEIADRLGLMCCEEPGLWQADTKNPLVTSECLEVLKRTVLRDRNHPSIVFWLAFNECDFDENFLKSAVNTCRENDPARLVSGANNMPNEDTLKYYNLCGLDFYTMHPYSETFEMAREASRVLCDKPLMFTEWGGYYVYDNPHLLSDFLMSMYDLYKENALAGTSIWYWAEINDYNRGGAACVDGTLKEALVDFDRKPNLIYHAFSSSLKAMENEKTPEDVYEFKLIAPIGGKALECAQEPDCNALLTHIRTPFNTRLAKTRKKQAVVGPVLQKEEICGISRVPYVITNEKEIEFIGGITTDCLSILGACALNYGYPILGKYGEGVIELTVEYNGGEKEKHILKNGEDITVAYTSVGSSRINPQAKNATRIAELSYDKNFEEYIINRLDILVQKKEISRVKLKSLTPEYKVLVYGIFA